MKTYDFKYRVLNTHYYSLLTDHEKRCILQNDGFKKLFMQYRKAKERGLVHYIQTTPYESCSMSIIIELLEEN